MKLNVGSGSVKRHQKGWVHIDLEKSTGAMQASVLALPFKDGAFEEVRAIHILEHIPKNYTVVALAEIYRVLAPGGVFYAEVPDFIESIRKILRLYEAPKSPKYAERLRIAIVSIYGKQRYPGDYHHWGFTTDSMADQLRSVGRWDSLTQETEMISPHHLQEPVILIKAVKAD